LWYDIIVTVQAQFGNGRRLSELGMETFFEDLKPLILLGQYIYNVYLYITTTVIDQARFKMPLKSK
jgi:hypothetical protein